MQLYLECIVLFPNIFQKYPFFSFQLSFTFTETCDPFCAYWTNNELSYELGGVGAHLTALSIHGFLYFSLVLISDSSIGRNLKICLIVCKFP